MINHAELLFIEGPNARLPKSFVKEFTSDIGIIKKAYHKLLIINKSNSLEEIRGL